MATTAIASRGRDVSHYQGIVDWPAAKARDRITWAMCKAIEGTLYTDPTFTANYAGAAKAGLTRGGYAYADPSKSPTSQAARLVSMVKPVAGRDFVCLDLEAAPANMSQTELRAWRQAFSAQIRKSAPGVAYGIYEGGYAHNGSGAGIGPDECEWWMFPRYASMDPTTHWPTVFNPAFAPNLTGFSAPQVWQYSPNVNGFDASVSTLTATQLVTLQGELSMTDITEILDAIAQIPKKVAMYNDPAWYPGGAPLYTLWGEASKAVTLPSAEEIAAAVVAALPAAATGGLTADQVEQAVAKVLTGGTAAVPAVPA